MTRLIIRHSLSICVGLIVIVGNVFAVDLVIYNGPIYTLAEQTPSVEVVVVDGGKITFAGSQAQAMELVDINTKRFDLQGKTMVPGFIESHAHLMGVGYSKLNLDLRNTKNYDEMVTMVAEAITKVEPGEWITGRGWHQSKWDKTPVPLVNGFQTHQALSAVSPNNPVSLTHASGHARFVNAKAMSIAGIDEHTSFTDDGEILKDSSGQPTGILVERASGLVSKHIPRSTPAKDKKALRLAIDECLRNGITSLHDAGAGTNNINLYQDFLKGDDLDINLSVMLSGRNEDLLQEWYAKGPLIDKNGRLSVRAIKLYADGALGSRGAWLLEEYEDRQGHFGNSTMPIDYIGKIAEQGLKHGFQVCTHAIGDRANREVLDQYEQAFKGNPKAATDHRFRIEHAQHISAADIPRFQEMGVIASMQGIHMASDRPWAISRLGEERIKSGAYVWQKLLNLGAVIINGTDAPVEPISVIASFYASVARKTLKGTPDGGYEADQRMTRQQALRTYTLDAAYGAFEESLKGSIEIGKRADFTILSQDIMKISEEKILDTKIEYTIVGGDIKFQRTQ